MHKSSEHGRLARFADAGDHDGSSALLPPRQPKQDGQGEDADEDADDEGHDLLRVPSGDPIDYHLNSIDEWFIISHHLRVRFGRGRRRR